MNAVLHVQNNVIQRIDQDCATNGCCALPAIEGKHKPEVPPELGRDIADVALKTSHYKAKKHDICGHRDLQCDDSGVVPTRTRLVTFIPFHVQL
jgi:hypothetical protein